MAGRGIWFSAGYRVCVLVLLPPSETKAPGGRGRPLELDALSFAELTPVRRKLADALVELSGDVPASLAALGLSERQQDEVERNAGLWTTPTMPALQRYTGVLYDALDVPGFTKAQRAKANVRLVVASALFGLVRGGDPIPAYRLSAGSVVPAAGSLRGLWRPALEPVLSEVDELVVDLRSGGYAALATVDAAVTVRVVEQDSAGRRKVVSHFNKAYKGRLANALAVTRAEPSTVASVIGVARRAGMTVEQRTERELDLVV